jgi:3-deoxy-D-manno-octulosonate 8-phosphate phosphatase (KDO 8-P phosphatase)
MRFAAPDALQRARRVKLMLFDVDGVLTDGRLWYGEAGEALKAFHSLDGHGIKMLGESGVQVGILSGRSSAAVAMRGAELGIRHVFQGVEDKLARWEALLAALGVAAENCGYAGDDLVDLPVLIRCGFACTVHEAPEDVRKRTHYVSGAPAGAGAVRELCDYVMRAQGTSGRAMERFLR